MHNPDPRQVFVALRPEIPSIDLGASTNAVEAFQNAVLRPVLKLQNPILIAMARAYFDQRILLWSILPPQARRSHIQTAIQGDPAFKNTLIGTIIGQFTVPEVLTFQSHEKELRKRTGQMLIQRLLDQVELL